MLGVYGTLKRGNYNYSVNLAPLDPLAAKYFKVKAKMFSNGRYPMLIKNSDEAKIFVEIYEINSEQLSSIDELEMPFGYHRAQVELGRYKGVWMYYFSNTLPPTDFHEIPSGNFSAEKDW